MSQIDTPTASVTTTAAERRAALMAIHDPSAALKRRSNRRVYLGRVIVLAVILVAWQGIAPHYDPVAIAGPVKSVHRLIDWSEDGTLWTNLWVSFQEVLFGYLVGCAAGVTLGILLSLSRIAARTADPFLIAVYGIPKIALAPLLVLWFGIDLEPKILLAGTLVFFVVFFTTYQGIRAIDRDLIASVRLLGGSRTQARRYVVLPAARRIVLLGLKLGVPNALSGAILGEFIVSNQGIGYLVQSSASLLDTPGVYAALITLMIMAVVINLFVGREGRAARRQTSRRL